MQDLWKRKLCQKFKNLRRPSRSEKAGIPFDLDSTVPEKKQKVEASIKEEPTLSLTFSDIAEYNEHCKHLQKVYSSHKWTEVGIATLLEETAAQHTKWILQESLTVAVILDKFPCLKEPKLVSIHTACIHNNNINFIVLSFATAFTDSIEHACFNVFL